MDNCNDNPCNDRYCTQTLHTRISKITPTAPRHHTTSSTPTQAYPQTLQRIKL